MNTLQIGGTVSFFLTHVRIGIKGKRENCYSPKILNKVAFSSGERRMEAWLSVGPERGLLEVLVMIKN